MCMCMCMHIKSMHKFTYVCSCVHVCRCAPTNPNPILLRQPSFNIPTQPQPTTTIFVLVARWVEDINNGNNKINNGNNEKQWM